MVPSSSSSNILIFHFLPVEEEIIAQELFRLCWPGGLTGCLARAGLLRLTIFTSGLVCSAALWEAKANQLMKVTYGPSVTSRPNLQTKATTVLLQLLSYYLNSIHPWHSQQHQNWSDQSPYTDGWCAYIIYIRYHYHTHSPGPCVYTFSVEGQPSRGVTTLIIKSRQEQHCTAASPG